jgi:acetyl-CoA carboxylase biotin carboxyl carrier protein
MSKSPKSIIDRDLIHELTVLLDETGLTEIEIEQDGKRIRVARGTAVAPPSAAVRVVATLETEACQTVDPSKHPGVVISPMVVYRLCLAGARQAFIDIGSKVSR